MTLEAPRILVIQKGARHDYAVPAAFHRFGALEALLTDFTSTCGVGGIVARLPLRLRPFATQLARRTPPSEVALLTRTSDASFLFDELFSKRLGLDDESRMSKKLFEQSLLRSGTKGATHIYSMNGEGGRFVQSAREKGLGMILDLFIAPSANEIEATEARHFPDWADIPVTASVRSDPKNRKHLLLGDRDILLCPSEFVREDVLNTFTVRPDRISVIPYAVNTQWLSLAASPEPGRVLFAGSANLRKGIHYLAKAATLLRGVARFRVAGGVSDRVKYHPHARDLTFLGHLAKHRMAEEFARADVLAFPSLAEGSASVTAEALGAGIPVVTTKSSGSIVRHGIDGLIVPERDPEALAQAVNSIVRDRDLRGSMSRAARERALEFTWDRFAREVIRATMECGQHKNKALLETSV